MEAEDKIALTEEQRNELARKEFRNTAIITGVGIVTAFGTWALQRFLDKKLIDEFTTTESTTTEEN